MIKKILTLVLLSSLPFLGNSQDDTSMNDNIRDEMTKDPEQNQKWKIGEYEYSARPKHAWELGIHVGHFLVNGDVPAKSIPSGYGFGLHLRRAINYALSLRLDGMYFTTKGLDGRFTPRAVLDLDNKTFTPPAGFDGSFRNFHTTGIAGSFELVVNIGNILFHKERNKWNMYFGIGAGLIGVKSRIDYLNGSTPYNWDPIFGITPDDPNSRERRNAIWDVLDGDFETKAENDRQVPFGFDDGNLVPTFVSSIGFSRKLSRRLNISFEHKVFIQDYDKLDGHKYRTTLDLTNNSDQGHYTNIRLAINLGDLSDKTEPLYWLNPLDATMNDIAELKQRPVLDLTDDDGDGIINMLDQESDTPAGCPVDTRGITLDSDGDGIPDCKDQEPYSPPGYDVDTRGIAEIPDPGLMTEQDVNSIVDTKAAAIISTVRGEWFLPMIHYDLDKYNIKPEFYGHLHHVATVMNMYPDLCITVYGHTDIRNSNAYNNVLSFNRAEEAIEYLMDKYGFDRDRFKLMYGGEDAPLASQSRGEAQHYMNRRVEFRVCQENDMDMTRPDGPNAGSSGKRSSSYSGNKNSGY